MTLKNGTIKNLYIANEDIKITKTEQKQDGSTKTSRLKRSELATLDESTKFTILATPISFTVSNRNGKKNFQSNKFFTKKIYLNDLPRKIAAEMLEILADGDDILLNVTGDISLSGGFYDLKSKPAVRQEEKTVYASSSDVTIKVYGDLVIDIIKDIKITEIASNIQKLYDNGESRKSFLATILEKSIITNIVPAEGLETYAINLNKVVNTNLFQHTGGTVNTGGSTAANELRRVIIPAAQVLVMVIKEGHNLSLEELGKLARVVDIVKKSQIKDFLENTSANKYKKLRDQLDSKPDSKIVKAVLSTLKAINNNESTTAVVKTTIIPKPYQAITATFEENETTANAIIKSMETVTKLSKFTTSVRAFEFRLPAKDGRVWPAKSSFVIDLYELTNPKRNQQSYATTEDTFDLFSTSVESSDVFGDTSTQDVDVQDFEI